MSGSPLYCRSSGCLERVAAFSTVTRPCIYVFRVRLGSARERVAACLSLFFAPRAGRRLILFVRVRAFFFALRAFGLDTRAGRRVIDLDASGGPPLSFPILHVLGQLLLVRLGLAREWVAVVLSFFLLPRAGGAFFLSIVSIELSVLLDL